MLKAGKIESLGLLAGGIAHDFNNLLTVILGNIALTKTMISGDEIIDFLDEVEKASLHAKSLTNQLLTFSRGGEPVKSTVSIRELVRAL